MRAAGYTLLELLVVLVIIAIIVSVAQLGAAFDSPERTLQTLAEREAGAIRERCDQAELSSEDVGFFIDPSGLRAMRFGDGAWQQDTSVFAPFGAAVELTIERDGARLKPNELDGPAIVCTASGEFTPFALEFAHAGSVNAQRIDGDSSGALRVSQRERLP
jgi:general secretion pathway protein H